MREKYFIESIINEDVEKEKTEESLSLMILVLRYALLS